jgi:predicted dehydrogenase
MNPVGTNGPLRIGLLGSGFIANFHLQALLGVRDAQVSGVFSPTRAHRETLANKANGMDLGPCKAYGSVEELVASDEVDAVWILGPNDTRLDHMRAISRAVKSGASLLGVACEKPRP